MQHGRNDYQWRCWGLFPSFPLWGFVPTSVLMLTALGKDGFDCESISFVPLNAHIWFREACEKLVPHTKGESFALSLTKVTMSYALSLQLSMFQDQGCDREQRSIIRDPIRCFEVLSSSFLENVCSFPNALIFTCCFLCLQCWTSVLHWKLPAL